MSSRIALAASSTSRRASSSTPSNLRLYSRGSYGFPATLPPSLFPLSSHKPSQSSSPPTTPHLSIGNIERSSVYFTEICSCSPFPSINLPYSSKSMPRRSFSSVPPTNMTNSSGKPCPSCSAPCSCLAHPGSAPSEGSDPSSISYADYRVGRQIPSQVTSSSQSKPELGSTREPQSQTQSPLTSTPQAASKGPASPSSIPPSTTSTTLPLSSSPSPAAKASFYRRTLPLDLVHFNSTQGRQMFKEAVEEGTMELYFPLAEQFLTQAEPAYCALSTLAMCMNALAIDPGTLWRKPWRWYAEDMLQCCISLDSIKKEGLTFRQFSSLARCHGVLVQDFRADMSSVDHFRSLVRAMSVTSSTVAEGYASSSYGDPARLGLEAALVVSFSRAALGQTGDGHMSPIGGYHSKSDSVLILDVARFKYPPYWVPVDRLFESMLRCDAITAKPRGYCVLSPLNDNNILIRSPNLGIPPDNVISSPASFTFASSSSSPASTSPAFSSSMVPTKMPPPHVASTTHLSPGNQGVLSQQPCINVCTQPVDHTHQQASPPPYDTANTNPCNTTSPSHPLTPPLGTTAPLCAYEVPSIRDLANMSTPHSISPLIIPSSSSSPSSSSTSPITPQDDTTPAQSHQTSSPSNTHSNSNTNSRSNAASQSRNPMESMKTEKVGVDGRLSWTNTSTSITAATTTTLSTSTVTASLEQSQVTLTVHDSSSTWISSLSTKVPPPTTRSPSTVPSTGLGCPRRIRSWFAAAYSKVK